jgi:hypothetical protein
MGLSDPTYPVCGQTGTAHHTAKGRWGVFFNFDRCSSGAAGDWRSRLRHSAPGVTGGARVPCLPVGVALAFAVGPNPQSWRVGNLVGNQATPDLTFQMSRKRSTVQFSRQWVLEGGGGSPYVGLTVASCDRKRAYPMCGNFLHFGKTRIALN